MRQQAVEGGSLRTGVSGAVLAAALPSRADGDNIARRARLRLKERFEAMHANPFRKCGGRVRISPLPASVTAIAARRNSP